jgi:hypothetical protein
MKLTLKQNAGQRISACIQKLSLLVFVSGAFMTAHGQLNENNQTVVTHKEINNSQAFENVEVHGDIVVFLTNEKTREIILQGETRDVNAVTTTETDNKLEINATKAKSVSHLIVYLPAAKIHSLKITGNAKVFSSGDVLVDDLAITLKGNSIVKVYHYGKLTITPAQGFELADVAGTY